MPCPVGAAQAESCDVRRDTVQREPRRAEPLFRLFLSLRAAESSSQCAIETIFLPFGRKCQNHQQGAL